MTIRIENPLLGMLATGDLRSDGLSREAEALVLRNPSLMRDLMEVLLCGPPAARGHAADAIERVSRKRPELVDPFMDKLLPLARRDDVAMVRWHMAMLLTNQALSLAAAKKVAPVLMGQLSDSSAFVRSWAISGLCVVARRFPGMSARVAGSLRGMHRDPKISVRHRAQMAIRILTDRQARIPPTWLKATSR